MCGKLFLIASAFRCVRSRWTNSAPVFFSSASMPRATMSRGARSPRGSYCFMNSSPLTLRNTPPNPLIASEMRNAGLPELYSDVGWNCMNSMFPIEAPARWAIATPSPVAIVGVRRMEIDLPEAPGADHRKPGKEFPHLPLFGIEDIGPGTPDALAGLPPSLLVVLRDQLDGEVVFQHRDVRFRRDRVQKRALDFRTTPVAGMDDPPGGMAPLESEVQPAGVPREFHPPLDQFTDPVRALPHQDFDGVSVAESDSGVERVPDVEIEGIVRGEDGGDSALGVIGVRFGAGFLGDDEDGSLRRGLQREGESGDAAPDDQEIICPLRSHTDHRRPLLKPARSR